MVRVMSLNVELSRHLHRFVPFVRSFAPDVLCLQEVVESDAEAIADGTGLRCVHFAAMARHDGIPGDAPFGVAIFSRVAVSETRTEVYAGGGDGQIFLDRTTPESRVATSRYVLASARLAFDGVAFDLATTHFPWTNNGQASDFQFAAVDRLIALASGRPIVLMGDFNAPRGGPVFGRLAEALADNIPAAARTTIDPQLHRAGPLELVVDGLFTSPHYEALDVRLHAGLSDHQAVSAAIVAA